MPDIPAESYLLFGCAIAWAHMLLLARWERLQAERKAKRVRAEAEWAAWWQARLAAEKK